MMELKSFNIKSLFKVGVAIYLTVMVFVGIIGGIFMLYNIITNFSLGALSAAGAAILVYIILTIAYSLVAGIIFAVVGFIYNKLAEKIGGIKLELEKIN